MWLVYITCLFISIGSALSKSGYCTHKNHGSTKWYCNKDLLLNVLIFSFFFFPVIAVPDVFPAGQKGLKLVRTIAGQRFNDYA